MAWNSESLNPHRGQKEVLTEVTIFHADPDPQYSIPLCSPYGDKRKPETALIMVPVPHA